MASDGIVIRAHGRFFIVRCQGKEIPCEIRGKVKFRTTATTPVAVGDRVELSLGGDGTGAIEKVYERRSMFFRAAKGIDSKKQVLAANLDQLAAVASVKSPDFNIRLIDRLLIAARIGNLQPLIIVNKLDLGCPARLNDLQKVYDNLGVPFLAISARTGEGCEKIAPLLKDHMTILAGHSGVGKTALINRLIPGLNLKEGEVSRFSSKGIHTTSLVELFELPQGGFLADSPGLKVMGLWEIKKEDLVSFFPEMHPFSEGCRFRGCSHTVEPDCAVREAVKSGAIALSRFESYEAIYRTL